MKLQNETIKYYVEDAQIELNKILSLCEKKSLKDGELLPLVEHALHMLNASFNLRYKTKADVGELSQVEWEKNTYPPEEIFG